MIATLTRKFFDKLRRKPYRDAYVAENVAMSIAHQVRALREQREWTQRKFADVLGSHASVVNRIEDPDYGKLSIQTLLDIARAMDIGLIVRFVGFPEFLMRTRDVSPEAFQAKSFSEDQFAVVDGDMRARPEKSPYKVTPPGVREVIAQKRSAIASGPTFNASLSTSEPETYNARAN